MTDLDEAIDALANRLKQWGLTAPSVALLEAHKPFTFLGSQLLVFLQPLLGSFLPPPTVQGYIELLQDRRNVERLIQALEDKEDTSRQVNGNERNASQPLV